MKRFFYVKFPSGRMLHIQFGKSHSAGLLACGRESKPGMKWIQHRATKMPVCKGCRP